MVDFELRDDLGHLNHSVTEISHFYIDLAFHDLSLQAYPFHIELLSKLCETSYTFMGLFKSLRLNQSFDLHDPNLSDVFIWPIELQILMADVLYLMGLVGGAAVQSKLMSGYKEGKVVIKDQIVITKGK